MTMEQTFLIVGVGTFASLSMAWGWASVARRVLCPLLADSLLNAAVLVGVFSVIVLSDVLDLVTSQNRASINVIFSLCAVVVQANILYVHQRYHRIVGGEEP
jgi:hypothetical protein